MECQKSEVRTLKSEVWILKFEIWSLKSEVENQKFEIRSEIWETDESGAGRPSLKWVRWQDIEADKETWLENKTRQECGELI